MAAGAANGKATPNSPNWAAVEAKNPIKEYQTKVLTGGDPATAAKAADEIITQALNTK
jgi:N,N'-diacetylchitobiose transport system substrate-binding protein